MSLFGKILALYFILPLLLAIYDYKCTVSLQRQTCTLNSTQTREVNNVTSAPVWFNYNKFHHSCDCTSLKNMEVICDGDCQSASIVDCWCATYDSKLQVVVAGSCLLQCNTEPYRKLTQNVSKLNQSECRQWNRDGALCVKCRDNFFPQVYSYNITASV